MPRGGDEVEAAMDPGVWDPLLPGDVHLLLQELLVLLVNVLSYWLPAGGQGGGVNTQLPHSVEFECGGRENQLDV